MGFLLRSHAAYLAAVSAVMAGQLHELQALLRVCLEQAGYGHFIGGDQARWERWMNRHEPSTRSQKEKWAKEFTNGNVSRTLQKSDAKLASIYKMLYDRTIDYGGHPNERGASLNSSIEHLPEGGYQWSTVYLHEDVLMLDYCIKATAQVGICSLRIAQSIYPARSQAAGVSYQLNDICQRY